MKPPDLTNHVVGEYLETLDDAAFGAPTKVVPKYISPVDPAADSYTCPGNKELQTYRGNFSKPRKPNGGKDGFTKYRASKHDCDTCPLKANCCPKQLARNVLRSVHEAARDVVRDIRKTDAYITSFIHRREVEMLFAHLKRYIGMPMMRLRGTAQLHSASLISSQNADFFNTTSALRT